MYKSKAKTQHGGRIFLVMPQGPLPNFVLILFLFSGYIRRREAKVSCDRMTDQPCAKQEIHVIQSRSAGYKKKKIDPTEFFETVEKKKKKTCRELINEAKLLNLSFILRMFNQPKSIFLYRHKSENLFKRTKATPQKKIK